MWWTYDNRVLIEPRRGQKESLLPSKALMVIVPEDLDELVSIMKGVRQSRSIFLSRLYHIEDNNKICIVGPLLGSPQAVMILEKLIALGVREVIVLGWCGSLQDYVRIGDVVIPTGAYSEEGTSHHYVVSCEHGSIGDFGGFITTPKIPEEFKLLVDYMKTQDVRCHSGSVWTTDAPYRETISKVIFYQNRGVLGVDMETSALISVARFRGISLGVMLLVSDSLANLKWKPGMKSSEFLNSRNIILGAFRNFAQK
ncbi:MAG: nucleoside phosphorylase [Thermodesulforhabdaceae bacterium]